MRKLTAGIFTLLLGLVSVGTAKAAVVSTEYLDQKLGLELKDMQTTTNLVTSGNVVANREAEDKYLSVAGTDALIKDNIGVLTSGFGGLSSDVESLKIKATQAADDILDINSDTVGWITVKNTNIDYPVVRTTDNDYYINRNFYHSH